MTISTIGTILGTLFFTRLADVVGRRPVFLGCIWSYTVISFIQALSPTYWFFTFIGIFEGFTQQVA